MRRVVGIVAVLAGLVLVVPATSAVAAGAGELDGFEYVSLGDSYQAGFGLGDYELDSPFSVAPDENGCYQSADNYPNQVAAALGLVLDDQTCSGAITANIGYGTGSVIPNPTLTPPASQTLPALPAGDERQTTALGHLAPQLQSAGLSASTDIVTVGIGGNDLGFADIAESCIRLTDSGDVTGLYELTSPHVILPNCADFFGDQTTYPEAYLPDRIDQLVAPRLTAAFDEIAEAAPNAQVFVVGYPQLMTADADLANACFQSPLPPTPAGGVVPFSGTDIQFVHDMEALLDGAVEAAATAHGFTYVSTSAASTGHGLCDPDPWIEGLDLEWPTGGTCPANYEPLGYDGNVYVCALLGALHPNQAGADSIAALVTAAIQAEIGVTVSPSEVSAGGTVSVAGDGFQPGESVEIWIHSTPALLSTVTASPSGAISTTVTIPSTISPGAHTIVATGLTSGHSFSAAISVALPATGSDPQLGLLLGLCLATAGFLALAARRRSR